jgi:hypothetical protein
MCVWICYTFLYTYVICLIIHISILTCTFCIRSSKIKTSYMSCWWWCADTDTLLIFFIPLIWSISTKTLISVSWIIDTLCIYNTCTYFSTDFIIFIPVITCLAITCFYVWIWLKAIWNSVSNLSAISYASINWWFPYVRGLANANMWVTTRCTTNMICICGGTWNNGWGLENKSS